MNKAEIFDKQVDSYEKLRDGRDKFDYQRSFLLKKISGRVLELAPGPGFNFKFYTNIKHLTAVDISPKMVESAKKKWEEKTNTPADFIVGDVEDIELLPHSFDYVVSTCSICAYGDPTRVLNKINDLCRPGGTVYLLEHGLSQWRVMQLVQHLFEPYHYKKYGCHCNRDIEKLLQESKLKVEKITRLRRWAFIDFVYAIQATTSYEK